MAALTPPPLRSPIDKGLCHPDWQRWFASLSGESTTFVTNFADPSAQIGLTAIDGVALTAMRSDAAPALNVGISPTWTGTHTFTHTIGGNISGNAATATLASTVTTNANLTGPITSVGNATSIASQTGTGTTFAMSAGPTFTGTVNVAALTASGLITASASGISLPSSVAGIVHVSGGTPYNIIQYAGGNSLYIGDFNYFDYVRYYVAASGSAIHDFKVGSTSSFLIGATLIEAVPNVRMYAGLTIDDLSGVGDRMVVADASGVLSTQAIPAVTLANPTALVGLTAVNGVATSGIRSDGAPALDQGIAPFWTADHQFSTMALFGESVSAYTPYIVGSVAFSILSLYAPFDDGGEGSGLGTVNINDLVFVDGQANEIQCFSSIIGAPTLDIGKSSQKWQDIWYSGTLHGGGASFSSTITASISGNAATATALQTARNINGTSFNGTADITVTAAAGTLTGATLNSTVTASSLTTLGTLTGTLNGATAVFTATVTGQTGLKAGTSAIAANIIIDGPAGNSKPLFYNSAGVTRWGVQNQATTQLFQINAFDSSGTLIDTAFSIANAAGGTVTISRPISATSTLAITGNLDINATKFNVDASNGNTLVAGTMGITGVTNITGNLNINTNKFNIVAASGNTSVAGTMAITGVTTVTGNVGIGANASGAAAPLHVAGPASTTAEVIRLQTGETNGAAGSYMYMLARHRNTAGSNIDGGTIRFTCVDPTTGTRTSKIGLYGSNNEVQTLGLEVAPAGGVTAAVTLTVTGAFGCNGKSAQTAVTANATVAGGTGTAAGGFDTAANRNAFIALVNQIRSTLIANGIMT